MKNILIGITCAFLIFLLYVPAGAEVISVKAVTNKAFITIGDKITYTLTVTHDSTIKVVVPIEIPFVNEFEVKDVKGGIHLHDDDNEQVIVYKEITFTTFEIGEYLLEGPIISYIDGQGEKRQTYANNLYIVVESVAGEGEVKSDIKDIKGVTALKPGYLTFLRILLILGGCILLARLLLKRFSRHPKKTDMAKTYVALLPAEQALNDLEELYNSGLIRAGKLKEFYSQLAEIMKHYLARHYNIDTIDRTTVELTPLLKRTNVSDIALKLIKELMGESDFVKFAKYRPQASDIQNSYLLAKNIIDKTRLDEIAAASPA